MTRAPFHDARQSDHRLLRSEKVRGKLILALRTDEPEARMAIFDNGKRLGHAKWLAHRELTDTIHLKLQNILDESSISAGDLEGIIYYKGPGSFTGLRIGLSVANALAYSQDIPIVASSGDNWLSDGIKALRAGQSDKIAKPEYGAPPNTTKPRK